MSNLTKYFTTHFFANIYHISFEYDSQKSHFHLVTFSAIKRSDTHSNLVTYIDFEIISTAWFLKLSDGTHNMLEAVIKYKAAFRSSRPEVACEKDFLKYFANLTEKHPCWSLL